MKNSIIRGTTPTLTYRTEIPLSSADALSIVIRQSGQTVLEYPKADCIISADSVKVHMSAEQSLLLKAGRECEIQMISRFGEDTMATYPVDRVPVKRILKEDV